MLKVRSNHVSVLLFIIITVTASAQQSERAVAYYAGISVNYTGERSPDFSLPVGFGLSTSLTLLKPDRFKPMIEMTAVGFPEFVISLTNNSSTDRSNYAYGQISLLAGSSVKILKPLHIILAAGPSYNSREKTWLPGFKPAISFHTKDEKAFVQLYYLRILNSRIIYGYTGVSVHYKVR